MFRHMDQKARMKYRKDCDEVFPGIIVGNGECIKDVRYIFFSNHHCIDAILTKDCCTISTSCPILASFLIHCL